MKFLIIYFSKFGNTHKIAEVIGETLQTKGSVRVVSLDEITPSDIRTANLILLGSPTHGTGLPNEIEHAFDALISRYMRDKSAAAFDTSYKLPQWMASFTAARRLAAKLRKFGARLIVPPETFYVMEQEGPLYEGEIEHAQQWAMKLLRLAESQKV